MSLYLRLTKSDRNVLLTVHMPKPDGSETQLILAHRARRGGGWEIMERFEQIAVPGFREKLDAIDIGPWHDRGWRDFPHNLEKRRLDIELVDERKFMELVRVESPWMLPTGSN